MLIETLFFTAVLQVAPQPTVVRTVNAHRPAGAQVQATTYVARLQERAAGEPTRRTPHVISTPGSGDVRRQTNPASSQPRPQIIMTRQVGSP